jgi:hypothetical protein
MKKFSTLIAWIQGVTVFLIIPMLIFMRLLGWCTINTVNFSWAYYHVEMIPVDIQNNVVTLPMSGKILFFALETLSTLLLLIAIGYFLKLLALYKKEIHFSKEVIDMLKKINLTILLWAVYGLLFSTFTSVLISLFKPAGERFITISVSLHDIIHFFVVLILVLILQLIKEAYKIKTEQDLVV